MRVIPHGYCSLVPLDDVALSSAHNCPDLIFTITSFWLEFVSHTYSAGLSQECQICGEHFHSLCLHNDDQISDVFHLLESVLTRD